MYTFQVHSDCAHSRRNIQICLLFLEIKPAELPNGLDNSAVRRLSVCQSFQHSGLKYHLLPPTAHSLLPIGNCPVELPIASATNANHFEKEALFWN